MVPQGVEVTGSKPPIVGLALDEDPDGAVERCCFCRVRTAFWTKLSDREPGQQVACCQACAAKAEVKDVPSKTDWCRRESIAYRGHFR